MRSSKDTFLMQSLVLSSHNFTPKRSELRYHCCLSQLYFIGLQQKHRVVFMVQEYLLLEGKFREEASSLVPATFLPDLVKVQKKVSS
jgi:hypothetical protein